MWDEVLEYRVWCHPERGAPDDCDGDDYYYAFATYSEALECFREIPWAEQPHALILQREHIDEPQPDHYVHITKERTAEWHVEFLRRPKRTPSTIPDFPAPGAPSNKLEIIRGLAAKAP